MDREATGAGESSLAPGAKRETMAMAACRKCDGSGKCHNLIHDLGVGLVEEPATQLTGDMFTCDDCGQAAGNPGECVHCDGTGET